MNEKWQKTLLGILLGVSVFFHALPEDRPEQIDKALPYIDAAAEALQVDMDFSETPEVSRVLRVYDGDTIYCNLDGWPAIVGEDIGIRFLRVDCPELRGSSKLEKQAAIFVRDKLRNKIAAADSIELKNIDRGKYFRILADVHADGESLSDWLLKNGYAKPYSGGNRPSWSESQLNEILRN